MTLRRREKYPYYELMDFISRALRTGGALSSMLLLTVSAQAEPQAPAKIPTTSTSAPVPAPLVAPTPPEGLDLPSSVGSFDQLELKRGIVLYKAPGAVAHPQFTSKLPIGRYGHSLYVENVAVEQGRVDATAPDKITAGVLLQGPGDVQAITAAGRVSIAVSEGHVSVTVLSGQALVGKAGVFQPLSGDTVRRFDLQTGKSSDHSRLGAPQVHSSGFHFSAGGPVPIELEATPVAKASSYCGYLFDQQGTKLIESCGHSSPQSISFEAPHAGTFWGAVRAFDVDGFSGPLSAPTLVRVLGLDSDAYDVKEGVVFLAPGQSARILGYEGLLMRYGNTTTFVPAEELIGLVDRKPTAVEFVDPKKPGEYVLVGLRPHALKSRIQIGPSRVTWPERDISISVQMWDGSGQSVDVASNYKVITRVGIEEVDVDFTSRGGELLGVLKPQDGPGPWVVRVSIVDPAGHELMRDFLEIGKTSARPPGPVSSDSLEQVERRLAAQ